MRANVQPAAQPRAVGCARGARPGRVALEVEAAKDRYVPILLI